MKFDKLFVEVFGDVLALSEQEALKLLAKLQKPKNRQTS